MTRRRIGADRGANKSRGGKTQTNLEKCRKKRPNERATGDSGLKLGREKRNTRLPNQTDGEYATTMRCPARAKRGLTCPTETGGGEGKAILTRFGSDTTHAQGEVEIDVRDNMSTCVWVRRGHSEAAGIARRNWSSCQSLL